MRFRLLLALSLLVSLSGAGAAAKHAKKKPQRPLEAAKPSEAPSGTPKEALLAAADEITRQVSALRGLSAKRALQRGVLSREEIGEKLKDRITKEYTPREVESEARVLKRLGLIPADADYQKMIVDLLMEQVAGFYDPFSAKLYIADWLPVEMQRPALAHEIEHALQDQHFDLKRFATPIKDDSDRQLAQSALVEGDGIEVMLAFQVQQMGVPAERMPELVETMSKLMLKAGTFGQAPLFDKAPAFLKETLLFPYIDGLKFVDTLHRSAPWSKVDDAFATPPSSTEQVLHPEKYAAHEEPLKIAAPKSAPPGLTEIRRDVLGELQMRILFQSKLPVEVAQKAAAGWGGDRLMAYASSDEAPVTVIDLSAWDSENDAKEAADAGEKLAQKLTGSVERHGDRVLMIFGGDEAGRAALAEWTWKNWKVGEASAPSRAQPAAK